MEWLWAFHQRRLWPEIPPAQLMDRVTFSQYPPVRIVRCGRCTHLYRNPSERETALMGAYAGAAPGTPDERFDALFRTQRAAYRAQARRLTRLVGRTGRGVEIGSYVGGFLAAAREEGWNFTGVDVDPDASAFAGRQGFTVTTGTLDDVPYGPDTTPVDAVAIWNTFEQLYDVRHACRVVRRWLRDKPGSVGVFVVRVPNGDFYARWRARLGSTRPGSARLGSARLGGALHGVALRVLAHDNLLTFPYRQGFTRQSLTTLLRDTGFRVIHVYGETLVPIADQWTTRYGALEERVVKGVLRRTRRGWHAPWVEVYAAVA